MRAALLKQWPMRAQVKIFNKSLLKRRKLWDSTIGTFKVPTPQPFALSGSPLHCFVPICIAWIQFPVPMCDVGACCAFTRGFCMFAWSMHGCTDRVLVGSRGPFSPQTAFDDVMREIAILKKLEHQNVMCMYDVIDDTGVNKL